MCMCVHVPVWVHCMFACVCVCLNVSMCVCVCVHVQMKFPPSGKHQRQKDTKILVGVWRTIFLVYKRRGDQYKFHHIYIEFAFKT